MISNLPHAMRVGDSLAGAGVIVYQATPAPSDLNREPYHQEQGRPGGWPWLGSIQRVLPPRMSLHVANALLATFSVTVRTDRSLVVPAGATLDPGKRPRNS